MLAGQRQMRIVEEVRRRGAVRVSELTELLGVSDMTIRRDFDVLAASGLLEKVHGGATVRRLPSTDEPGFEKKSHRQLNEKEAIARAASKLVEPGQAIAITAGTTTWRLAHHLVHDPESARGGDEPGADRLGRARRRRRRPHEVGLARPELDRESQPGTRARLGQR